jgi:hypothetical protein
MFPNIFPLNYFAALFPVLDALIMDAPLIIKTNTLFTDSSAPNATNQFSN